MSKQGKIFYGWWIVLLLMVISGSAIALTVSTYMIYQNQVINVIGISPTQFSLSTTLIFLTSMLASPMVGRLIQQHTKPTLIVFLTGFCVTYAAFGYVSNLWLLYILAVLLGFFFTGLAYIPPGVLVNRWFIEKKGLAMSISLAGSAVLGVIFSKYITYCIQHYDYSIAYISIGAGLLISGLLMIVFLLKDSPESIGLKPLGSEQLSTEQAGAAPVNGGKNNALVHYSLKQLYATSFFWAMLLAQFLAGFVGGGIVIQLPVYLQNTFDLELATNLLVLNLVASVFAKILVGWVYDKLGLRSSTLIIVGSILMTCLLFIMISSPDMWLIGALAVIIWSVGNCVGTVTTSVVASRTYGPQGYGEIYGTVMRFQTLGMATGVPAVAKLYAMSNSFAFVWSVFAGLTFIMLVAYLYGLAKSNPLRTNAPAVATA